MITFKQFLAESRPAPLYHGSPINYLENIIIKRQGILAKTSHEAKDLLMHQRSRDMVDGVSASRSFDFAALYKPGVVFELDQRALSNVYKIVPVQFWNRVTGSRAKEKAGEYSRRNEYEEFIITNKAIPIKYITRIWVSINILSPMSLKYYRDVVKFDINDVLNQIRQQYGSSFIRIHNKW